MCLHNRDDSLNYRTPFRPKVEIFILTSRDMFSINGRDLFSPVEIYSQRFFLKSKEIYFQQLRFLCLWRFIITSRNTFYFKGRNFRGQKISQFDHYYFIFIYPRLKTNKNFTKLKILKPLKTDLIRATKIQ